MQARHLGLKWKYRKQNITSIDFMLEFIIDPIEPVNKKAKLPDIVKLNFPSKKTFSKILTAASPRRAPLTIPSASV